MAKKILSEGNPSSELESIMSPQNTQEIKSGQESEISTALSLSYSFDSETSMGSSSNLQPSNASTSAGNRKRSVNRHAPMDARKSVCSKNPEDRQWGYSTTLKLYDDPWKIKKVLTHSDLGELSRLLLPTNLVEDLVLPVLGADAQNNILTDEGIHVEFWDVDTNSMHKLVLKRWSSSKSYVFIGSWNQEFVKRRDLKKGDEIGLHWDSYKNRFDFSVLKRA